MSWGIKALAWTRRHRDEDRRAALDRFERIEQAMANPERAEAKAETNRELARQLGKANAEVNQHIATIRTLNAAIQDWQEQLAEAEATISGLGLENADLRRAIVDADDTAARTVTP